MTYRSRWTRPAPISTRRELHDIPVNHQTIDRGFGVAIALNPALFAGLTPTEGADLIWSGCLDAPGIIPAGGTESVTSYGRTYGRAVNLLRG